MLSALTSITGIIILPILLIEYMHQKEFKKENIRKDIIWIILIGVGLLVYLAINHFTYGDALKFLEIQIEHWNMQLSSPTKELISSINSTTWDSTQYVMYAGWFQLVFAITSLALIIYSFFKIRVTYSLYALANWLVITSSSFLSSTPRYILTFFLFLLYFRYWECGRRKILV